MELPADERAIQDMTDAEAQYADAVVNGGGVPGGKPLTVQESYKQALGCGNG